MATNFVGCVHRTKFFSVKFAKGRQRTVQMQLIRWMQAASGTAGRAKRWDSPCI